MTYLEELEAKRTKVFNEYAHLLNRNCYYFAREHKKELKWIDRQIRKEERRLRRKKHD